MTIRVFFKRESVQGGNIMLIPAILVSIVALLAAMDEQLFGASMMARPLFTGPIKV